MCIRPKTNFYVDFQEENKWNSSNGFFSFLGIVLLLIFGTTIFFGTLTGVTNSDDLQLDIQSVMVISPVQENNTSGTILGHVFLFIDTVFPRIVYALTQFPPLNSFCTFMYCDQRSQYIKPNSIKNSFRRNYLRKYGNLSFETSDST